MQEKHEINQQVLLIIILFITKFTFINGLEIEGNFVNTKEITRSRKLKY